MIDFLSDSSWLKPQIDFLLFWQGIRMSLPDVIDKLFLSVTVVGEYWLPTIICAVTYWCIDFRAGVYLFTLEGLNIIFAHFFKMIACVYRPWVLDTNIQPSALAVPYAKGYSFPSGHSAMSSSVLGGVAYLKKKNKLLSLFLILLILTVGFSRMWLGVHTPQDVVCGLAIGLILVFAGNPLINWAEKNSNRYLYLLGIINIFALLALVYIYFFNTCRIDYVDGNILVDPMKQKYIAVVVFAFALGLINGCFLCRKFYPFEPKKASIKTRIARGVVGAILVIMILKIVVQTIVMNIAAMKIAISSMFGAGIFVTLIYPIIFTQIEKHFCSSRNQD